VQFAVLAFPPRQPAGLRIVEGFEVSRLESVGELRVTGLLLAALQLRFQVSQTTPRAIDQRIAVTVLWPQFKASHHAQERAGSLSCRNCRFARLDQAIAVHVALRKKSEMNSNRSMRRTSHCLSPVAST